VRITEVLTGNQTSAELAGLDELWMLRNSQETDFVAPAEPLIRNISDTALLAAVYRARETERQDALFRDPFARRLAGKRGDQIADSIPFSDRNAWA
jgi:hypothetical protein